MAAEPTLILYDVETKKKTFSPYVFRTRMTLNYKKLGFKTEWTPLTGIRELYEKVGIPATPHPVENPHYTVPALIDTSVQPQVIVSQSFNIDRYLDEKFPENPLWSVCPPNASPEDSKRRLEFLEELSLYLLGEKDPRYKLIFPLVIPYVPDILFDVDVPYFKETRSRWFGVEFSEIEPKNPQEVLNTVKDMFSDLGKFLDAYRGKSYNPQDPLEQPWVLVDQASWADFALVGLFKWIEVTKPSLWDEMKTWNDGRWLRLVDETAQWR